MIPDVETQKWLREFRLTAQEWVKTSARVGALAEFGEIIKQVNNVDLAVAFGTARSTNGDPAMQTGYTVEEFQEAFSGLQAIIQSATADQQKAITRFAGV